MPELALCGAVSSIIVVESRYIINYNGGLRPNKSHFEASQ